jgi:hypothetical protein
MKLKALVGSGGKVMGLTMPFLFAGIAASIMWPAAFRLGFEAGGIFAASALGAVLYVSTRIFAPAEEKLLERYFPVDYPAYRAKVLLPWL